jgi:hypothetical protein
MRENHANHTPCATLVHPHALMNYGLFVRTTQFGEEFSPRISRMTRVENPPFLIRVIREIRG